MDSIDLRGQRALVTGASSGIGAACALALGRAGAAVAVNYLDQKDAAERMCAPLHDAGALAVPLQGDVSSEQDVERVFRTAIRELGGLDMLMRSLAQEVANRKIRVNCVSPGAIRTNINRPAWDAEEACRRLLELIPNGRVGEPEDVAHVAAWLASDLADYVTGATIYVDGGMTLYPAFQHGG